MIAAVPFLVPVSMTLPFTAESARDARRALSRWLRRQGSTRRIIDDAELVATELIANAVRHAEPLADQTLVVGWRQEHDNLVLSVYDGGGSEEPHLIDAPAESESGRGLAIVDALSLDWRVERYGHSCAVHVHLPLR